VCHRLPKQVQYGPFAFFGAFLPLVTRLAHRNRIRDAEGGLIKLPRSQAYECDTDILFLRLLRDFPEVATTLGAAVIRLSLMMRTSISVLCRRAPRGRMMRVERQLQPIRLLALGTGSNQLADCITSALEKSQVGKRTF
jgi:hypothetical protein